jgi:hypothetical protein
MAALLFGLLLLIVAGLTAVLGIGWFAVFPALVALGIVAWGGLTVASGRTPASELRHAEKPELLGPGGPDDPDRET